MAEIARAQRRQDAAHKSHSDGHSYGANGDRSGRADGGVRSGAAAARRRILPVPDARSISGGFQREDLGKPAAVISDVEAREHFNQLISAARLDNHAGLRSVVIPRGVVPLGLSGESESVRLLSIEFERGLDAISDSTQGVTRGMPLVIIATGFSLIILLINPGDWIGELKGALAVLVPVLLYWLKQRRANQTRKQEEMGKTSDSLLRFSSDKEKRLEERESKLRQEEREFNHRQIELSRRRGHILARGYMAFEMANARLIQLLQDNKIDVPPILFVARTREQVLGELKAIEDEQNASDIDH